MPCLSLAYPVRQIILETSVDSNSGLNAVQVNMSFMYLLPKLQLHASFMSLIDDTDAQHVP